MNSELFILYLKSVQPKKVIRSKKLTQVLDNSLISFAVISLLLLCCKIGAEQLVLYFTGR